MTHIWQGLRSGEWLTATRARGYSLILLGISTVAAVGWVILSDGLTDLNGKPIGTDFSSFYAAGSMALEGHAADAYDMAAHYARQQQIFGASTPYYAWFYPPFLLFIAAPLALLPYPAALIIWQVATLAFYVCVIGAILQPIRRSRPDLGYLWVLLALAFPAVFINLGHGQNGLLTAALLGAALLTLARQPLLSGTLFGLLAYKPQLALVIAFALPAAGQWRAITAAAAAVTTRQKSRLLGACEQGRGRRQGQLGQDSVSRRRYPSHCWRRTSGARSPRRRQPLWRCLS